MSPQPKLCILSILIALLTVATAAPASIAQAPSVTPPATVPLPAFEAATIKPCDPTVSQPLGFYSRPGGRVLVGCTTVKMLAYYAFGIPEDRISVAADWAGSERFNVVAVPPDSSPSRTAAQPTIAATPSSEQRLMLQSLLADRFKLRSHIETRDAEVYILSRGSGKLLLEEPKDKDADARGAVVMKQGGIVDGEAFGENVSMQVFADTLGRALHLPVLDQTGLAGRYDFRLPPVDPENHDMAAAVFDAMHRLGLSLKKGRGPVQTLVIDHIERPTEN